MVRDKLSKMDVVKIMLINLLIILSLYIGLTMDDATVEEQTKYIQGNQ